MLAGGWLFGPGPAWFWLLVVAAVVCVPPLLSAVIELLRKPAQRNWLVHAGLTGGSVLRPIVLAAVSYTHLRAHETVLDLECRLLLEKKT